MSTKITYIKWRNRLEEITPRDHRVGTDLLLIDNSEMMSDASLVHEPFKVDMTMTIIYEEGSADLMINMQRYHIQAPAVLIIMNDQIYQPLGHSENLKSKVILMSRNFADSLFTNISNAISLQSKIIKHPVIKMQNDRNVFGQFYQLMLNIMKSPYDDYKLDVAKHLTLAMFYGYSSHQHGTEKVHTHTSRQEELYELFIKLLQKNYRTEREIKFYAEQMYITPKYLSALIKKITGKTTRDIIDEYLIAECKAILLSTNLSIQQISCNLNFPSQSVFGKYFKRLTGISPKEYRQRHITFA